MKKPILMIACAVLFCAAQSIMPLQAKQLPEGYPSTERVKTKINDEWMFRLGGANEEFYAPTLKMDDKWEAVTIPHTLKLTDIELDGCKDDKSQKTFHREVGWYRRTITPSKNAERVILDFEGVHQITTLWVNGKKVGTHEVGGYTPFQFDISDYVKRGAKNQITILADNRVSEVAPPDPGIFDYIKFSGLYRDVYLLETDDLHITSNLESMTSGVTITTPSVDWVNGNATIDIRTEIRNESKQTEVATLIQRVVDREGKVVLKLESSATIPAGASHRFVQIGGIDENVRLWSPDDPYLYKVNTLLLNSKGKAIDVVDNRLGLRKIDYDHERGFVINGKPTEIIGMNRHQHYVYIGDAMPNSLHYRDMAQLKEYGFNTMRMAHYPQDDEIVRACDELGILVYEEAPTWIAIPSEKKWFENFHKATRAMIRNHKNSPSIFIWGAGINHRGVVAESHFLCKEEDPTRFTASQSSRWTGWQASGWSDIFANMNYGAGIWEREEPLFAMEGWSGPEVIAKYKRDDKMPGMISWTAHAYYTFHPFKPTSKGEGRMRLGELDGFRYEKKPSIAWYKAESQSAPFIHLVDNWAENLEKLTIYSNATELEFVQNGEITGRYLPSKSLKYIGIDHPPFEIENPKYLSSHLTINGYEGGRKIFEKQVYTPQEASELRLIADSRGVALTADGNDIIVVHAEILDANGTQIKDFYDEVKFSVEGDAIILGEKEQIGANPVSADLGKASVLIRAGKTPGKIKVSASAQGLQSGSIEIESVAGENDMILAGAYPIYDRETMLVDLGGEGQLVQFGWTPWIIKDQKMETISLVQNKLQNYVAGDTPATIDAAEAVPSKTSGAYTFSLETTSKDGVLRALGEMNVIGHTGFVYGDGVLGLDKNGIKLTIEGLKAGEYTLTSYHHAPSSNTDSMDPNLEKLKKESTHKLPYAKKIDIFVDGKRQKNGVSPTSGKAMQYESARTADATFSVGKDGKVEIIYKSGDKTSGVWLNGFKLIRNL